LFDGRVLEDLIHQQWDGLMRVITSFRKQHAAPDAVVQRLANAGGAGRPAKALTRSNHHRESEKKIFLLRWLPDPELRYSRLHFSRKRAVTSAPSP
jgi:TnpA family transposase